MLLRDKRILAWTDKYQLQVWDADNGELLITLLGHTDKISGVRALSSGIICSWSRDSIIRLWDVGEVVQQSDNQIPEWHHNHIVNARVLSSGNILSWSDDKTLRLWSAVNGALIRTYIGHKSDVIEAMEMSEDQLVSLSSDKTVCIWETTSGKCIATFSEDEYTNRNQYVANLLINHIHNKTETTYCITQVFDKSVKLAFAKCNDSIAWWQADCLAKVFEITDDGILVVGQDDYQLCILQLFYGNKRITLKDIEDIFPEKTTELSSLFSFRHVTLRMRHIDIPLQLSVGSEIADCQSEGSVAKYLSIADSRIAQGDLPDALYAYQEVRAITEHLAAIFPENALWQRDLGISCFYRGHAGTHAGAGS